MAEVLSDSANKLSTKGIVIEIPLKPKKRMISLRINEEALATIDKFVALTGEYSRTLLITKVIEALAEGLRRTGLTASSLELRFTVKSPDKNEGESKVISVVIPLKSK